MNGGPTILVTASTGNVGSLLVDALSARGARPIAGISAEADAERFRQRGIDTRVVRFDRAESLEEGFAGVERLFLLFPLVEGKLEYARNAARAARAAGVAFILRSSGAGAAPGSPYALMRLQADIDALIEDSGVPFVIGRPATFMQNTLTYYQAMLDAGQLYMAAGDGRQPFIDLRDLARVYAAIMRAPDAHVGRRYDLTGPEPLGYADLARIIGEEVKRSIGYTAVPEEAARGAMRKAGIPEWNITMLLSLSAACREGTLAEVTATVEALAGQAPTPFRQFVADHRQAWAR